MRKTRETANDSAHHAKPKPSKRTSIRVARQPEFVASPVDLNERLARNDFTVPPTENSARV